LQHHDELQVALTESYNAYLEFGARSPSKIYPLHKIIGLQIGKLLSRETDVYAAKMAAENQSGEVKVSGAFYQKNVDITLVNGKTTKSGKASIKLHTGARVELCVGVKFVTSNYKQNINNYFEGMIGETTNIQANGIPYGQLIVLPEKIPYFAKNGTLKRWETLDAKDLKKYLNLMLGQAGPHKPAFIAIKIVSINPDNSVSLQSDDKLERILPGSTPMLTWDNALTTICGVVG